MPQTRIIQLPVNPALHGIGNTPVVKPSKLVVPES
jgi:hypothetical protein